jgi:predicted DNA binding CopG/RHH family protein
MEKTINFKVDENLYREIKIKLAKEGKTLKSYILELIEKDLKKEESK